MGQPVVHFEVIGKDPDTLRSYYGQLFGWTFGERMGPTDYTTVQDPNGIGGGIGGVPEGYDGTSPSTCRWRMSGTRLLRRRASAAGG